MTENRKAEIDGFFAYKAGKLKIITTGRPLYLWPLALVCYPVLCATGYFLGYYRDNPKLQQEEKEQSDENM